MDEFAGRLKQKEGYTMPPIVTDPYNNGNTTSTNYWFANTNGHNGHGPVGVYQWKVTVTTQANSTGALICDSGWRNGPITSYQFTNLPANNGWYYTQVLYKAVQGGITRVGVSNYFQSKP
jgi:hypothetical protein